MQCINFFSLWMSYTFAHARDQNAETSFARGYSVSYADAEGQGINHRVRDIVKTRVSTHPCRPPTADSRQPTADSWSGRLTLWHCRLQTHGSHGGRTTQHIHMFVATEAAGPSSAEIETRSKTRYVYVTTTVQKKVDAILTWVSWLTLRIPY